MPDGIVIFVVIVVVGLIVVVVRSSSRGPGPAARPPEAPASRPRTPASYGPLDLESSEDFYEDEDEFAVFGDEGDE